MSIWEKLKARNQSVKAFKSAGLYLGDIERPIFPRIRSVQVTADCTSITFTLPNGLDPKLLTKNLIIFQQYFGKDIQIDGEIKRFTLIINKKRLPRELTYQLLDVSDYDMPIVCGKDSTGRYMIYDAVLEPNALISGEPGAGKSTQLRSILTTLIQTKTHDELHIYLGDLKMSEFFLFKGVKHVKSVCVYTEDMAAMLAYLHAEMKRRGELLNKYGVTHINKLSKKPPYILLCIDEIVMIMDDKQMKKQIVQLVALGRALGIYCILSLQRPSHDILDTKIRGLLTVRMGFRTTDLSNSRIIGTPGSEKISKETPGRFLIKRDELTELQAPYLTEEKAEELLASYKEDGWMDMFTGVKKKKQFKIVTEEDVFSADKKR
ncbi:DNA translocase FtsK [Cytobacillus sp. Sa5YUA1]|uniref:DNA translocase FtsK n=1 Tax=Cytobacillus stercorigallinarum TaxID=2762240 RepID=A0ABR8QVU2_9BACI|nr:FtsK/SpoIIIE domain-containing protein [Cytobacillus stercorigallinarum]MBD7939636.1 DNA translocase FtsK [Cytobacillus stercorigallinarum]